MGNKELAEFINGKFGRDGYRRVTHVDDPVPLVPLEYMGYVQHGHEIFVSKKGVPPEREDVRWCEGSKDPECVEGTPLGAGLWLVTGIRAHRDYFHRLGICLPVDDEWKLVENEL